MFGDEAHTRKNIEKMLEYENKSGQTTVRPDGCFEIVNSLLGHTSYGRIHNVQPAQER